MTGRSIRLFLVDGVPSGIVTAEIINWTGHVLFGPRSRLVEFVQRQECVRTGVYFLSGADPEPFIYIGEADNVSKRLVSHNRDENKGQWDRVCVVTSKDQNLTKAHVRYLEGRLIGIASAANRAKLINGTAPAPELPEADTDDMEYFIEQIRIVLPVLGLEFLKESGAALVKAELKLDAALNGEVTDSPNSMPIESVGSTISSQYGRFRPSTRGMRSPEFELKDQRTGVLARAFEINGEMVVLKDSTARKETGDSLSGSAEVKRISLINSGTLQDSPNNANLYVFSTDTPFSSPSQASAVILARSDNGRTSWCVRGTHTTYAAWQEEQLGLVTQADYSGDE